MLPAANRWLTQPPQHAPQQQLCAHCSVVSRAPVLPTTQRHRTVLPRLRSSNNGDGGAPPQSIDDDSESGLGKLRFNKRESELPKELQGLEIGEDGELVDTKTGKVINEFGAGRFDVAVRALRGELDPAPWVENTERNAGVLLSKLVTFPTQYTFQVVGKVTPEAPKDVFVADMVALLSRVCEADIDMSKQVTVTERLKGKYVSMSVDVVVRAPEVITLAYEKIGQDSRVKMKF